MCSVQDFVAMHAVIMADVSRQLMGDRYINCMGATENARPDIAKPKPSKLWRLASRFARS